MQVPKLIENEAKADEIDFSQSVITMFLVSMLSAKTVSISLSEEWSDGEQNMRKQNKAKMQRKRCQPRL